jgi:hypothetical protein
MSGNVRMFVGENIWEHMDKRNGILTSWGPRSIAKLVYN